MAGPNNCLYGCGGHYRAHPQLERGGIEGLQPKNDPEIAQDLPRSWGVYATNSTILPHSDPRVHINSYRTPQFPGWDHGAGKYSVRCFVEVGNAEIGTRPCSGDCPVLAQNLGSSRGLHRWGCLTQCPPHQYRQLWDPISSGMRPWGRHM